MELSSRVHFESAGRKITEDYRECLNFRQYAAWEALVQPACQIRAQVRSVSRETLVQVFMSVHIWANISLTHM
jgi:hypothetical protein